MPTKIHNRIAKLLLSVLRWGSLVLVVLEAVAWFGSYHRICQYRYVGSGGGLGDMMIVQGAIQLGYDRQLTPSAKDGFDWMLGLTVRTVEHIPPGWQVFSGAGATRDTRLAGFRFVSGDPAKGSARNFWSIRIPFWIVICASAAVAAWLNAGTLWRRISRRPGLCAHCGYDMRATPDRCPECGQPAHRTISDPNH